MTRKKSTAILILLTLSSIGLSGCFKPKVDAEIASKLNQDCESDLKTSYTEWKGGWKLTVQCGSENLADKLRSQMKNSGGYQINPDQGEKVMSFEPQ